MWLERARTRPVLSFVGRASDPRKNLPLFLATVDLVRHRIPELTARIIGEPPLAPVPEGVEIVGSVRSGEDELRESTLLLVTSWQEGFGIVAAEALASGIPVISTPSGGPEEMLRRSEGGRVVGAFDAHELAGTVESLLGDVATLRSMRARGREHV